jgi:murein DD-endopeptidase MepM/ murein hydrolase activator NlpD
MEENNRQNHRENRKRRGRGPAREERTAPRKTAAALEERPESRQPSARRREESKDRPAANFLSIQIRRLMRRVRLMRRRLQQLHRENQARNFPESDALPVLWLLLGWNMLPMLGSLVWERITAVRKRLFGGLSARLSKVRWKRMNPATFLGVGCAMVAVVLVCSTYTVGVTVSYDGEVVAAVASQSLADEVRSKLESVTTRTLGESFTIDDSLIQYSSSLVNRQDVVDEATLQQDLSEEIGLVTPAYCLYVDGEYIGATPYEGALEELLANLKEDATNENTISCEFAEDVEIRQEYVPSEEIMNLGYLAETLYSTKSAEVTYEVKKGDTWSEIANSHGLTSKELLALNPGYNIDKLQIGEVLTLSASVPYLTMTVVQQERYVDEVNYDIVYTDSANMYKGDYKVTSPGQYGAADVVANVTYVNGEETERTILSSVTLREPVTEQRLQGTKDRPTWLPTGSFRWPTSGRITSYFGGRRSPGGIGSTNHKGIDIANSYGAPVYAADGGTVTYAGWMGGYGYLVQISHGNGYVTYYGHNSSLLVSVGQHVYKGQQIARIGSTGNSTGNHCHFEIRYNGVAKNPLNYLR